MKTRLTLHWIRAVVLTLVLSAGRAWTFNEPERPATTSIDKRKEQLPALQLSPARQQAALELQARVPSAGIAYDELIGSSVEHGLRPCQYQELVNRFGSILQPEEELGLGPLRSGETDAMKHVSKFHRPIES